MARVEAIRQDRTHGATSLAREALQTLEAAAGTLAEDVAAPEKLRAIASELASARPAMAAIGNAVGWFLQEFHGQSLQEALSLCRGLVYRLDQASAKAAGNASSLIADDAMVLTCSYSSGVIRALRHARSLGTGFDVAAMESWWGGVSHGASVKEELEGSGITVELIPDESISQAAKKASLVMVGADRLLPDGSVVNGAPTLRVATEAYGFTPFYVVCESFKLGAEVVLEGGFEHIQAALITAIATDRGVLPPGQVRALLSARTGW